MRIYPGAVDQTTYFVLRDTTTGEGKTALDVTTIDLTYTRDRTAPAAKADATALAATDSVHADNKAIEVDTTDAPGLYRIDWPDAAFATGAERVQLTVKAAGVYTETMEVELKDSNPYGVADKNVYYIDPMDGVDPTGTTQANAVYTNWGHTPATALRTFEGARNQAMGAMSFGSSGRKVFVALGDIWTYDGGVPGDSINNSIMISDVEMIGNGHRIYTIIPQNWSTWKAWNRGAVVRYNNQRFRAKVFIPASTTVPVDGALWLLQNAHCGDTYAGGTSYSHRDVVLNAAGTIYYISRTDANSGNVLTDTDYWTQLVCTVSLGGGATTRAHSMKFHDWIVVKDTGNGIDTFATESQVYDNMVVGYLMTVPTACTVTFTPTDFISTAAVHNLVDGDRVEFTATAFPAATTQLAAGTTYYVRTTGAADPTKDYFVYTSYAYALAGGATGQMVFTDAGTAVVMWQYPTPTFGITGGAAFGFCGASDSIARHNTVLGGAGVGVWFYGGATRCVAENNTFRGCSDSVKWGESHDCESHNNRSWHRDTSGGASHGHYAFGADAIRPVSINDWADSTTSVFVDNGATLPKTWGTRYAQGTDGLNLISHDAQDLSPHLDVNTKTITNGIIAAATFAAGAINAAAIADASIDAATFAAGAINAAAIADGAIDAATFAAGAIDAAAIKDAAIDAATFAAGAINEAAIANDAIHVGAIKAGAIDGASIATDAIHAGAVTADAVTKIQSGLATGTNQTTILARLGAFTGTGVNTVIGFFKALMSKTASNPSDVGGTYDAATDSTQAVRDNMITDDENTIENTEHTIDNT